MFTLPHHVEFLSQRWIDEARRFLAGEHPKFRERQAPAERLRGRAFSASGRFTDAPPHMKLPGDVGCCTIRFDGQAFAVSGSFDPGADLVVEGDYQAALTGAQMVGIAAPGALQTLRRETAHLYGAEALTVRGGLADPAVRGLLESLFDHLGRMTVENPDLAHRAARQGLSQKIREMDAQGYTIVENAITPEFADEAREAIVRTLAAHGYTTMNWMLYHGRVFERLALNPLLMTLIDASLGRGAVIGSLSCIRKPAGPGFIPLHTDYAHVPEPYPDFAMTGVGVWAFEDWTEASGPTVLLPGTHRMRREPRRGEELDAGVPILMPKGSVVFFTQGVWHWQGDRSEAGDRITLHSHFNRGILRSLEAKKIDAQMIWRNPPRLGEMLGEDDWFEKTTAEGRDYGRYAYMRELLAFTEAGRQRILAEGKAAGPAAVRTRETTPA
ncbi:MAG TPA: phytanoyl-CoA dioxygenase family protein [Phenylobacterium sp.]|uniref:phytanoyl-CoA dioxygenase family protein n=1 Tax=Phenylobacterium sp. TaxID=1871053 RepID=UPI002CE807BC|nr:phytanoyl-CoA dioxygenase family protein [Phenylobacterium sp.]HSV03962.1 phytanoyl-CoA dioxygenase family protein [Phenylobacterium sp.]